MKLATTPADIRLTEPVAGITCVTVDGAVAGYVLEAGAVFVSLRGAVYNTACEIGQSLDRETAIELLLDH